LVQCGADFLSALHRTPIALSIPSAPKPSFLSCQCCTGCGRDEGLRTCLFRLSTAASCDPPNSRGSMAVASRREDTCLVDGRASSVCRESTPAARFLACDVWRPGGTCRCSDRILYSLPARNCGSEAAPGQVALGRSARAWKDMTLHNWCIASAPRHRTSGSPYVFEPANRLQTGTKPDNSFPHHSRPGARPSTSRMPGRRAATRLPTREGAASPPTSPSC